MSDRADTPTPDLLDHVLMPVANEADAEATAAALEPYAPGQVTALHVVEKGGGVPDKTPVEQSEEIAETSFEAVRAVFPNADTHTDYARDVIDAIIQSAEEVGASSIVYHSRGGSRLLQFLSGDRTLKLVTRADRPVIALPDPPERS
jgi:nucleotide-binding universal stress UspA family protein